MSPAALAFYVLAIVVSPHYLGVALALAAIGIAIEIARLGALSDE